MINLKIKFSTQLNTLRAATTAAKMENQHFLLSQKAPYYMSETNFVHLLFLQKIATLNV